MCCLYKYPEKLYRIIRTAIYNFLVQHPFLDACTTVIRKADDRAFCKMVAERNDLSMICYSLGGLHQDKNIYFIHHGNKNRGLFAQMNELLKYLAYADRFGFKPVVVWDSSFPYTEKEAIMETKNSFEYFFVQPSGISPEETYQSYNVFLAKDVHVTQSFLNREIADGKNGYWMSEEYMEKLSEYVKKYIRLNSYTEEYLKENIERIIDNKKMIGVHIRGGIIITIIITIRLMRLLRNTLQQLTNYYTITNINRFFWQQMMQDFFNSLRIGMTEICCIMRM